MLDTKHASIARKKDAKENEVNSYLQEIDSKPVRKFQSLGQFTVIILIMVSDQSTTYYSIATYFGS